MGALPYKTNGIFTRWEPYHIKQVGTLSDGNPTGKKELSGLLLLKWPVIILTEDCVVKELDFYYIDLKYIRDLAKADDNVMSISPQRGKQNRPFVGVVVIMNSRKYCIPLTSPKEKFKNKKSQVDFIKIFDENVKEADGKFKLIGVRHGG